jgi:CspA family cold shock protein
LLASVKEVGTVKWFDDKKGYGFLRTHAGDLFVHARHVAGAGYRTLAGGQAVRFFRRPAGSGRAGEEAVDVEVVVPGAESPA